MPKLSNSISPAQASFLDELLSGKTARNFKRLRNINNKTGQSLQKRGLAKFVVMVGWIITSEGVQLRREVGNEQ